MFPGCRAMRITKWINHICPKVVEHVKHRKSSSRSSRSITGDHQSLEDGKMAAERKWEKRARDWEGARTGTWWPAPLMVANVRPPSYVTTQPATCCLWNHALHPCLIFNPILFMLYLVDVTGTLPSVSPLFHHYHHRCHC